MKRESIVRCCLACLLILFVGHSSAGAELIGNAREQGGIPRFPDVSATQITFLYGGELWIVSRQGGRATIVPTAVSPSTNPKFSPDGKHIAFTGAFDGIYTVSVDGGPVTRLTHKPGATDLCDWTPDGNLLFMSNTNFPPADFGEQAYLRQLFIVSSTGGLPHDVPLGHAANGAISPDGKWLAYTPYAEGRTEHRQRYRGGFASDIWLYGLKSHESKKITSWPGTDTSPMWNRNTVYYLSDGGTEGRRNLWSYRLRDGERRQITHFSDFDVKWPSMGPGAGGEGEIVFVKGTELFLLDLSTGHIKDVQITIPGESKDIVPRMVDVAGLVSSWNWSPSPDGKQVVFEARGGLWVLSEGTKPPFQLPHLQGTAQRYPSWSPDGRSIAFFSDTTGEYELYTVASDGTGSPKQLTHLGPGFRFQPVWSPNSELIAFPGGSGEIFVCSLSNGNVKLVTRDPLVRRPQLTWSPDSRWLAFPGSSSGLRNLWLYDNRTGHLDPVTGGGYSEAWPAFDSTGSYLFFVSNRNYQESLIEDSVNYSNFAYPSTQLLMAVPLRRDLSEPWKQELSSESRQMLDPDLSDIERSAVVVTSEVGSYSDLGVSRDGKLVYTFTPEERLYPKNSGQGSQLRMIDFSRWMAKGNGAPQTIVDGVEPGMVQFSGDRKMLLLRQQSGIASVGALPDQKPDERIKIISLKTEIDPRSEWLQIYTDAWRLYRDFFYDPHMRGVDWPAMRNRYAALLPACANREDVDYVIGELIGELGSSHVYLNSPPHSQPPSENVGLLGADFVLEHDAYRFAHIYDSAASDPEARGPLKRPGVKVSEGDYLLAIDGKPLDTTRDPWAAFEGMAGRNIKLTVSSTPKLDATTHDETVVPEPFEIERHRGWVETNRAYVDRKSGGRVGYMYLKMTSEYGYREFTRQFAAQTKSRGLIIDIRWNQGGQIPYYWIDLLRRRILFYGSDMRQKPFRKSPDYIPNGPVCVLINGVTQSGGDVFSQMVKSSGVAKLVGSRTKGDMAGAGGVYIPFVDGGSVSLPTVGFFNADGRAIVAEGEGVKSDIDVADDPTDSLNGPDPQLDKAISLLLEEMKRPASDR